MEKKPQLKNIFLHVPMKHSTDSPFKASYPIISTNTRQEFCLPPPFFVFLQRSPFFDVIIH